MRSESVDKIDYLFIGLGAANCLMLLSMHKLGLLSDKAIGIIEPNSSSLNERNFCFWSVEEEVANLHLTDLISSKWGQIQVAQRDSQSISPLYYFHVRGIDLYTKAKEILQGQNVRFYTEAFVGEPRTVQNLFAVRLGELEIVAESVYDSRTPSYELREKNQSHLLQSFYGWTLQTGDYTFDKSKMVMMDFDIPQHGFCQFMYILPFGEDTALFEVTRFGKEKISKEEAEALLGEYVARYGFSYQILEEEKGVIPMSSADIVSVDYGEKWVRTGASANMVKPTTGYAFYNMAVDAKKNAEAMRSRQPYRRHESPARFKFYDGLLLKILEEQPQIGKPIFERLFKYAPIKSVLSFLSEKSALSQEIWIFARLPLSVFLRAAFKDIIYRVSKIPPTSLALIITLMMLALLPLGCEQALYLFLVIGFFTVGLSHGAVDHIINEKNSDYKQLLLFSIKYIGKGALLGVVWLLLPDLALALFLAFSAWHFGQADLREWNIKHRLSPFLWGGLVLLTILSFHLAETLAVLESIDGLQMHRAFIGLAERKLLIGQAVITLCAILLAAFHQSKQMLITLCYLLLSSFLPLMVSFGLYFVLQHSLHGWRHLKSGLKINSYHLWLKSLPFSIGGAIIISAFVLADSASYISLFFILLSCMSMPHVVSMHHFYLRPK